MANQASIPIEAAQSLRSAINFEIAGKYESAQMALDEALAIKPDYIDAWLIKGIILGKLGTCVDAQRCYDKILEIDPNYTEAYRLKAAIHASANQYEKAAECFSLAVGLEPSNLEFRLSLAGCLQKLKRTEEALKCYAQAKEQDPNNPQVDYCTGLMWNSLADYEKALASFEDALLINPIYQNALIAKGIMLAKLGRKDEAKECANKLLEIKGQQPQQQETQSQPKNLNDSIREEYNAAQKKFKAQYSATK